MPENCKGIVLAGGAGTRLRPITRYTSKHLIPIYDKPMIYYPLSSLMLAGIKDILIITNPEHEGAYRELLRDGSQFGVNIEYKVQNSPDGLAQAFIIGSDFIKNDPVCLVLGDNIFYGANFGSMVKNARLNNLGATIFGYSVADPRRFGVAEINAQGDLETIVEKPERPKGNLAIPGLYFFDNSVVKRSTQITKSARGEFEITAVLQSYLMDKKIKLVQFGRGFAWFDAGTFDALNEVSSFVRTIENRQGLKIACLEEIALANGWISKAELQGICENETESSYWNYVASLVNG